MSELPRVRLPRHLNRYELAGDGVTFPEVRRLHPSALSIDLSLYPLSTATMTLPERDGGMKVHDFVELYNQHGSVGIFQVTSIESGYNGEIKLNLNHALDTLNDAVWIPGAASSSGVSQGAAEVDYDGPGGNSSDGTGGDGTGGEGGDGTGGEGTGGDGGSGGSGGGSGGSSGIEKEEEFNDTVEAYLTRALTFQTQGVLSGGVLTPFWQLGSCSVKIGNTQTDAKVHKKMRFNNILEVVSGIAKEYEDYWFTFDFTTFPWTLNFVRRDDTVMSEFRLRRNISSLTVNLDDQDMCTVLYLSATWIDEKDGKSRNEQRYYRYNDPTGQYNWGDIVKTAGLESSYKPGSSDWESFITWWVQEYFEQHRNPAVQIDLDGLDLKETTGVSLDEAHLGRVCRVALPDYGETLLQRVVEVSYPDAIHQPQVVKLSLSNRRETAEDSIASAAKNAKAGALLSRENQMAIENANTDFESRVTEIIGA